MYLERKTRPCASRICLTRSEKLAKDIHHDKLRTIRPTLSTRAPPTTAPVRRNRKKEQMMEERYTEIERENRLLLQRMSAILHAGPAPEMTPAAVRKAHSLNEKVRRQELIRITQENQAILRRIQACEPFYDHAAWEEDARVAERRMESLCLYKKPTSRPGSAPIARPETTATYGERPVTRADFPGGGGGGGDMDDEDVSPSAGYDHDE